MIKSTLVIPKPRGGRPSSGGRHPVRAIRLSDEFISQVDAWATVQEDQPGRSEAIRRLVELGLTVKAKARPRAQDQKDRAKELAGKAIDKMIDVAATDEVKLDRKRRLIKGPEEFRDARVDRKPK